MSRSRKLVLVLALALAACRFESAGFGSGQVDGDGIDVVDGAPRIDGDPLAPDGGPIDARPEGPDADPSVTLVVAESDRDLVGFRRLPGAAEWDELGMLRAEQPPRWAAAARSARGGFLAVGVIGGGMVRNLELHGEQGGEPTTFAGLTPELARVRGFDLAVEHDSGHALAVFSNGTQKPYYATATAEGAWSAAMPLPINDGIGPTLNTGNVEWIQLAPAAAGDTVALVYSDSMGQLSAILWDGAAWVTSASGRSIVTTNLKRNAVDFKVQNRVFDAVFEGASGDLVVAFGREGQFGFGWSQWDASSSLWSLAVIDPRAPAAGETHFVDLAAEPGSDRIAAALCDLGDGVERLGAATWDGSSWISASEVDSQARDWNDEAQGRFPCAAGWHDGSAVVVYADDTGPLSWARWQPVGGWLLQADVALDGVALPESFLLVSGRELVGVVSDDNKKLSSLVYDGDAWTQLAPEQLSDKLVLESLPVALIGP